MADTPNFSAISDLLLNKFESTYGFHPSCDNARTIIMEKRTEARTTGTGAGFNKMVNEFNSINRTISSFSNSYRAARYIQTMRKRYEPKDTFIDETGQRFEWKNFEENLNLNASLDFVKSNTTAVQFGNSVTDKERGYILQGLTSFIRTWQANLITKNANISPVSWSFGARGNSVSVAFFQPSGKIISVNRDNIGSIAHEVGHFIDYAAGNLSRLISSDTVRAYRDTLPTDLTSKQIRYYCDRKEIFARAFEAYSYEKKLGFDKFAQSGDDYLPVLNAELIALIEKALNN